MKWTAGLIAVVLLLGITAVAVGAVGPDREAATSPATATPAQGSSAPRLDVAFCVDTTGSMSDEIEVVKEQMRQMVAEIAGGEPTPDVRFGLVIYRDRGDEYVTKRHEFTRDVDQMVTRINEIVAAKGGDYPESMNEALHVAVQEMDWDLDSDTGRLIFLIADAPPHMDYENDYNYQEECTEANAREITIDTIGCSGLKKEDEAIFEEIASLTLGTFQLLTYAREYVDDKGDKKVVMWAGGHAYALGEEEAAAEVEWREGAMVLARRGHAKRLAKAEVSGAAAGKPVGVAAVFLDREEASGGYAAYGLAGDRAFSGPRGERGEEGPRGAAGLPAPAMGGVGLLRAGVVVGEPLAAWGTATRGGRSSNNLDYLLTRQVQLQLARRGVRFADRPYLPRGEWRGGTCAQATRRAVVVRTQEQWERIWPLVAEAEDRDKPPVVNFDKDMVIVAFAGDKWRGRTVKIEDVWEDKDGLHVRVGRGADDAEARRPYHIIVVSRYEGTVIWK